MIEKEKEKKQERNKECKEREVRGRDERHYRMRQ